MVQSRIDLLFPLNVEKSQTYGAPILGISCPRCTIVSSAFLVFGHLSMSTYVVQINVLINCFSYRSAFYPTVGILHNGRKRNKNLRCHKAYPVQSRIDFTAFSNGHKQFRTTDYVTAKNIFLVPVNYFSILVWSVLRPSGKVFFGSSGFFYIWIASFLPILSVLIFHGGREGGEGHMSNTPSTRGY